MIIRCLPLHRANRSLILGMLLSLLPMLLLAQTEVIQLDNPSFEGYPRAGTTPEGWYDCGTIGFPDESPPDIHPNQIPQNGFGVSTPAKDGNTYLGLVVRDNDSWESVSQRLDKPLVSGDCYSFSLYLARSANYVSAVGDRTSNATIESRAPETIVNHNTPVILRIWGGNGYCDKSELLGSTEEIAHEAWIEYNYKFEPSSRITHLTLEAFYKTPTPFPYNGNLLIDNVSDLVMTPCKEEPPVLAFTYPSKNNQKVSKPSFTFRINTKNVFDKEKLRVKVNNKLTTEFKFDVSTGGITLASRLRKGKNTIVVSCENSVGMAREQRSVIYEEETLAVVSQPKEPIVSSPKPKSTESALLKRSDLRKGRTIRIDKLYFPADSATIKRESYGALEEIFDFLRQNGDVKVEIGGHTNNVPSPEYCNRLSNDRAKAVVDYLVKRGIGKDRLTYKGYGKTKPIAANTTKDGRKKNQRVEIKILSYNG